jgi:chemotaxis protein histidine kinase CheA
VDQIKEQMDQLAELGDDQVVELQSSILKQFELVEKEDPTPQTVDAMTSLADMLDGVRNEVKRREAAAIELAQRATEAASRVYGQDGEKEEENMEAKTEEAPMAEEAPVAPVTEEAPAEEAPVSDTPAPMEEEKKMDEAAEMPVAPEKETPSDMEEDEKKKEEETMTEASTEAGKNTEFSTESQIETPAPVAVVEEPVVAAAEESVAPAATEEAPTAEVASAEAPVAEAVAETVVDAPVSAEASVETVEGAEASIQETSTQASEPTMVQENMEAPVTAAANADNLNIEVPADRRPTSRTSAAPVAITAGADIPGYTAGSPLDNMNVVAEAMAKRLHGLRRVNGGDGEQHIVASVTTSFPEDRTLTQDAESNWAKINAVTSPEALVASGGHAAPFETKYDIFGLGTTARPVRDALPRFQADRGGIRFVTPPVLSSYGDAVGVWTNAVDTNPGTDVKASLTVSAAAEQTVATDAVTLQLQFGNLMTRAYPELIARHNELGLIQHAREAEQNLLSKISSASTAVTTTSLIGFGRDFLVQLGRAAAAYRSRHRLEADAPLRAIIPAWVKDAMAADLALAMPGDGTLNAYAEIDGYVASRGVALSASLDQNVFGSQSASAALNEFADSFTWYLFAEGSFLFLDGGTLDLGIIRDSTLVGTNDYKMFVETFEGIAFIGVEALVITSTISINGVAAALRDTTGGATAAAIEY